MHSVGEIDIQVPWRAEHHFVALGFASVPVAGDVVRSAVCFYFHDAPGSNSPRSYAAVDTMPGFCLRFAVYQRLADIHELALRSADEHFV